MGRPRKLRTIGTVGAMGLLGLAVALPSFAAPIRTNQNFKGRVDGRAKEITLQAPGCIGQPATALSSPITLQLSAKRDTDHGDGFTGSAADRGVTVVAVVSSTGATTSFTQYQVDQAVTTSIYCGQDTIVTFTPTTGAGAGADPAIVVIHPVAAAS